MRAKNHRRRFTDTGSTREPWKNVVLAGWEAITKAFESFPKPKLRVDEEGSWTQEMWVFRGQKDESYPLQPSIEREAGLSVPWAALEFKILQEEFQPKARMHMDPSSLPAPEDVLSWLALMQHYGVPTRLLDFTLSPFVALYFALRDRTPHEKLSKNVVVWAIDARLLRKVSARISGEAYQAEVKCKVREPFRATRVTLGQMLAMARSDKDTLVDETEADRAMLSAALRPHAVRRNYFDKKGFVAFALPPVENQRLSSQQGCFLFNGAEALPFQESLFRMMDGYGESWRKLFRIPTVGLREIEERLFQMNIHELSLFPDMQGLAGLIRQKLRLYWVPERKS
jgi:hypothetical protein